jgi:hypothetical protein
MVTIGVVALVATLIFLVLRHFERARGRALPLYGWLGVGIIAAAEILLFRRVWFVTIYMTPLCWTGYLLAVDAAVFCLRGESRLRNRPKGVLAMALASIPLWLVFEAYNLRLENWAYVGLPLDWRLALLGYAWSFATIIPALLLTADWIEALGIFPGRGRPWKPSAITTWVFVLLGALLAVLPLVLPKTLAPYLFGLVWLAFIFLLDPINMRLNVPSILGDFAAGRRARLYSLLSAGWVCGWLWEFWNYWAGAKWIYVFPIFQRAKIFEMPIPGYVGFLPFAVECFAMWQTLRCLLRLPSAELEMTGAG